MQPFDILDRKTPVLTTQLLEASAGTGKTFAIEHLTIRLLLSGIEIREILLVTFTKAVAREMRLRIRKTLIEALTSLQREAPPWDYLQEALEKDKDLALIRLKKAQLFFEEAQIFTVHGFCNKILQEKAFETSLLLHKEDEISQAVGVALSSVRTFLKQEQPSSEFSKEQLLGILRKYRYDTQKLEEKLTSLTLQDKKIPSFPSFEQMRSCFESELQKLPSIDREKFLEDCQQVSRCYKEMRSCSLEEQAPLFAEILTSKSISSETFDQFLKYSTLFLEKVESGNLKVRAKVEKLHYPGLFDQMRGAFLPIHAKAKDPTTLLLRMAHTCRHLYKEKMEDGEVFSPDNLLQHVAKHLNQPLFLESIRSQYHAVIIDEFQDTDPLQWEIFKTLFLGKIQSFCLVGDPKQAIYAFRKADIYTYLNAKKSVENTYSLNTNYRSTPKLIQALNALFSLPDWMPIPAEGTTLPVPPVQHKESSSEEGGIHFFVTDQLASSRSKKQVSEEMEENLFFPFIAHEILKRKEEKGWKGCAVLVKDRFQAQRIDAYLKKVGIPTAVKRKGLLTQTHAYIALCELLTALCFPRDASAVKKALSGPFFGYTQEELTSRWFEGKERVFALHFLFFEQGVGAIFDSLKERLVGDLFWDVSALIGILIEEECHRTHGFSLLLFLEKAPKLALQEEEKWQVRQGQGEDAVQILTIHVSKGLEFDTVFAYGLLERTPESSEITLKKKEGDEIIPFDPEDPLCQKALTELDAEKLRLFYVALTRAKTHLYIPLLLKGNPPRLGTASPLELFFAPVASNVLGHLEELARTQPIDIHLLTPLEPPSFKMESEEVIPVPKKTWKIRPQEESLFSFTSLSSAVALPSKNVPKEGLPLGKETGIFLHHLLEKILQTHSHTSALKISQLISELIRGTPYAAWQEELMTLIPPLFTLPLKGFTLADLSPEDFLPEMEFLYPVPKGMMKGVIDLAFRFEGIYYFLDWKSNFLESYTQEAMQKEITAHDYTLQAKLYTEALKRYVKLFDIRPFEVCFGGAFYIFVRGKEYVHFRNKSLVKSFF